MVTVVWCGLCGVVWSLWCGVVTVGAAGCSRIEEAVTNRTAHALLPPPPPRRCDPSQILEAYFEARDPDSHERQVAMKHARAKEDGGKAGSDSGPAPACRAPAPAAGPDSETAGTATHVGGLGDPAQAAGLEAPVRSALGRRVLRAMELRYHALRCGTHLKSGTVPALFPVSSCVPPALPVTRACVRPLVAAAARQLRAAGESQRDSGLAERADALEELWRTLSGTALPSIAVLFNPDHATVGPLVAKYGEAALPGCVFFTGGAWHIPLSPLVLHSVVKPDPAAHAREVDFGHRGRHTFRQAPGTAVPSGGKTRCSDPFVFVNATHGCFSLTAVPPKGAWIQDGPHWVADPGVTICLCGCNSAYVLPEDLYTPREKWDGGKTSSVKEAEAALGRTRSRAWTIQEHWAYARARAQVRGRSVGSAAGGGG